jgi:hypothetical protein
MADATPPARYEVVRARMVMTDAQIDKWIRTTRHQVMYCDESKID